jgi:uncharacterized protein (DUF924 family)
MEHKEKVDAIVQYWFGESEGNIVPSKHMLHIWFDAEPKIDAEIKEKFLGEYQKTTRGEYSNWEDYPRSCLAQIIVLDQFSRHIFRNTPQAFAQDQKALDLCLRGIERQHDHLLSLLERAFFYFPLMHAEGLEMQAFSVRAFQMLVNLAFPETRGTFEKFLEYAVRHYEAVRQFNRFPQRNAIFGRESTPQELEYLKTAAIKWGD